MAAIGKNSTQRISIVTPSFNQGDFLEQTIDSVLSQNYPNLEYIIIDGGSTDKSVEVIKKNQKYLAYWVSEKDRGQSHAINKGFQHATGDVINWLNSDDYYEPRALEIVNEFFQDPSINVLVARSNIIKNAQVVRQTSGTDVYENNLPKTAGWARIDQPETFFRLTAHREIGPLNESLHYVMDREWWMRYLLKFGLEGIVKTKEVIVNFRLHDKSKTVSDQSKFDAENEKIYVAMANQAGIENFLKLMSPEEEISSLKFPPIDADLAKKILNYYLLLRAEQAYYVSNFKECLRILKQVNFNWLADEDQLAAKKISQRAYFLPSAFHKFVKRWK
jgi:glycosyltransferase involved in cell wall biosynthesis